MQTVRLTPRIFAEIVDSPDDGGWYFNIFNREGQQMHQSEIYPSASDARKAVKHWFDRESR